MRTKHEAVVLPGQQVESWALVHRLCPDGKAIRVVAQVRRVNPKRPGFGDAIEERELPADILEINN